VRAFLTRVSVLEANITFCLRCATSCLLCYLAMAYPYWALVFQFLIALDFSSHYMHMYRCVAVDACAMAVSLTVPHQLPCNWLS
jgi:hypothetical protein